MLLRSSLREDGGSDNSVNYIGGEMTVCKCNDMLGLVSNGSVCEGGGGDSL